MCFFTVAPRRAACAPAQRHHSLPKRGLLRKRTIRRGNLRPWTIAYRSSKPPLCGHPEGDALDLVPMLAERGLPTGSLDRWAVEPKLDGWRATVLVDDGKVVVRTRRGHAITEMIGGLDTLATGGHRFLFDGELVAGAGRASDFYALAPRLAGTPRRRPTAPLSFWAFDLLWLDGDLLIDEPYADRRAALEAFDLTGPCAVLPRFEGTDAADLLAACVDHDVEGIVLKRLGSPYHPGERSREWRKVRAPGWTAVHAQRRRPQ
jgi:bifunctional non-homologous end joining protein LigD